MKGYGQSLRDYMAGAFIAFGIVLLASEVLGAYFAWAGFEVNSISGDLLGLSTCLHIAGGALGGYFVGRRKEKDIIKAGATTSLFAYILEFIFNLFFVGSFVNRLWAVFGFVFGGVLGAMYANYRRVRRILTFRHERNDEQSVGT